MLLKDFYKQPEKADLDDARWAILPRCFVFDHSDNVVIFDYVFDDGEVPEDLSKRFDKIQSRQYTLVARTAPWINNPSGHASENKGFIIYPICEWIDTLIQTCNMTYVSGILKTLVKEGLIKSFTV